MQPEAEEPTKCVDIPWKCDRCESLLAYALHDVRGVTHMRFKIRDLYIRVLEPLEVRISCRKCGWENSLTSERSEEILTLFPLPPDSADA